MALLASLEDLLDGGQQAVGVREHDAVELLPAGLLDGPPLQRFKIQADAGDGCLEFVGYGVQEGVLALVTSYLAYEEDGVEDYSSDQHAEEDYADYGERDGAFVQQNPADVEGHGESDEEHTHGDEGGDGSAASGDVHGRGNVSEVHPQGTTVVENARFELLGSHPSRKTKAR